MVTQPFLYNVALLLLNGVIHKQYEGSKVCSVQYFTTNCLVLSSQVFLITEHYALSTSFIKFTGQINCGGRTGVMHHTFDVRMKQLSARVPSKFCM